MSPAKHPQNITPPPLQFTMGTINAEILCSSYVSQRHGGWNQKSHIWTHQTKGQISTSLKSIAQVSWLKQVFFLLVSFSSGFFAAIRTWRPDSRSLLWTVDVEMCLLLELCETFIWAEISEAGNSNELILCSRGNSASSFPVAVLMKAIFIIALDGFCDCSWRNFQNSWLSFMS